MKCPVKKLGIFMVRRQSPVPTIGRTKLCYKDSTLLQ